MMNVLRQPEQIDSDDFRFYLVIRYLTYLGIPVHLFLVPLFLWLGFGTLAIFNVFSIIMWIYARVINQRGYHTRASAIIVAEVCMHTSLAVYFLGWQSGFQYYLIAGIPFVMFNHKSSSTSILFQSIFVCLLFILLYALFSDHGEHFTHAYIIETINYINILISFSALIVNSFYFRKASFITERQMEALANIDQLTGLVNRRGMNAILNTQYNHFSRNGVPFCLILADVDYFKNFNDQYGHDCGDYVLQEVAKTIKLRLRQYDVVSRWGGEEFLVILPDTDVDAAIIVAEHIRNAIEEQVFSFNGKSLSVTMTLGVAQHKPGNTIFDTIKQADGVLYIGKEAGRNSVVSAMAPPSSQSNNHNIN